MNKAIIIRGAAGVGKSTVAKLLAKKISVSVFHYDRIMTGLGLGYIQGEKWIPLARFLQADKVMIPKFKKRLEHEPIILEGNFYHQRQIEHLVEELDCFVITLKAPVFECLKRDKTRKGVLGKEAVETVFKLCNFSYGETIDTMGKVPEEICDLVLSKLENYK